MGTFTVPGALNQPFKGQSRTMLPSGSVDAAAANNQPNLQQPGVALADPAGIQMAAREQSSLTGSMFAPQGNDIWSKKRPFPTKLASRENLYMLLNGAKLLSKRAGKAIEGPISKGTSICGPRVNLVKFLSKKAALTYDVVWPERHPATPPKGSSVERLLSPNPGQAPNLRKEKALGSLVEKGAPQELSTVEVQLGGEKPGWHNFKRVWNNPRSGFLGKAIGMLTTDPWTTTQESGAGGPYYNPLSDIVVQPWNWPASTVHELGHAIDFNKQEPSKYWLLRQLQGLRRDAYTLLPAPGKTLWKEFAAWRKGQKALETGARETAKNPQQTAKIIGDLASARKPALGSYVGATAGAAAGLPLAVGAGMAGLPLHGILLMQALQQAGAHIGLHSGAKGSEEARAKAVQDYLQRYKLLQEAVKREQVAKPTTDSAARLAKAAGRLNKKAMIPGVKPEYMGITPPTPAPAPTPAAQPEPSWAGKGLEALSNVWNRGENAVAGGVNTVAGLSAASYGGLAQLPQAVWQRLKTTRFLPQPKPGTPPDEPWKLTQFGRGLARDGLDRAAAGTTDTFNALNPYADPSGPSAVAAHQEQMVNAPGVSPWAARLSNNLNSAGNTLARTSADMAAFGGVVGGAGKLYGATGLPGAARMGQAFNVGMGGMLANDAYQGGKQLYNDHSIGANNGQEVRDLFSSHTDEGTGAAFDKLMSSDPRHAFELITDPNTSLQDKIQLYRTRRDAIDGLIGKENVNKWMGNLPWRGQQQGSPQSAQGQPSGANHPVFGQSPPEQQQGVGWKDRALASARGFFINHAPAFLINPAAESQLRQVAEQHGINFDQARSTVAKGVLAMTSLPSIAGGGLLNPTNVLATLNNPAKVEALTSMGNSAIQQIASAKENMPLTQQVDYGVATLLHKLDPSAGAWWLQQNPITKMIVGLGAGGLIGGIAMSLLNGAAGSLFGGEEEHIPQKRPEPPEPQQPPIVNVNVPPQTQSPILASPPPAAPPPPQPVNPQMGGSLSRSEQFFQE